MADEDVQRVRRERRVVAPDPLVDQARARAPGADGGGRTRAARTRSGSTRSPARPAARHASAGRARDRQTRASRSRRRRRPPKQRADSRDQLLVRERLDEIVVGAGLETGDAVAHRVPRGQHQHRQLVAVGAEPLADLDPVHSRASSRRARPRRTPALRSRASASSPPAATSTSKPCETRTRRSALRKPASSSTTRIATATVCVTSMKRV